MNTITNAGAVNCRTMAFAAVVSLLEIANRVVTPIIDSAPMRTERLMTILSLSENQVRQRADNEQADDGALQEDDEQLQKVDGKLGTQDQSAHFI